MSSSPPPPPSLFILNQCATGMETKSKLCGALNIVFGVNSPLLHSYLPIIIMLMWLKSCQWSYCALHIHSNIKRNWIHAKIAFIHLFIQHIEWYCVFHIECNIYTNTYNRHKVNIYTRSSSLTMLFIENDPRQVLVFWFTAKKNKWKRKENRNSISCNKIVVVAVQEQFGSKFYWDCVSSLLFQFAKFNNDCEFWPRWLMSFNRMGIYWLAMIVGVTYQTERN